MQKQQWLAVGLGLTTLGCALMALVPFLARRQRSSGQRHWLLTVPATLPGAAPVVLACLPAAVVTAVVATSGPLTANVVGVAVLVLSGAILGVTAWRNLRRKTSED